MDSKPKVIDALTVKCITFPSEKDRIKQLEFDLIAALSALQDIAAGNLDGETLEEFADRAVRTAKGALK